MNHYVTLTIAILSEVLATTALKQSDGFSRLIPSIIVICGFAVSFYFLSVTLKTMPVGIAYAIWSGAGIVAISLIGWLLFGQKLDLGALAGIGFIMTGVVIINVFSKAAH